MLASSYEHIIKLLDTSNNFNEIKSFNINSRIYKMLYSPNNRILAIISKTKMHIIKDNVYFKKLDIPKYSNKRICFSPDSKYLASKINDHMIIIWDCDDNFKEILTITIDNDTETIFSLQFSIDGKFLIVGSTDDKIIFFNKIDNFSIVEELCIKQPDIYFIKLSPCGKFLIYRTVDKIMVLDCYDNYNILKCINTKGYIVNFSLDGKFLAVGYYNGNITIFDSNNNFNILCIFNTEDHMKNVCFSPINNGKMYLAAHFEDFKIKIFDCYDNFNEIYILESIIDVASISFSPITSYGENFLIAYSFRNRKSIEVWDCNNNFTKNNILPNVTTGILCFENDINHTILW